MGSAGAGVVRHPFSPAQQLLICKREIELVYRAVMIGSIPIEDALLWYTDWLLEKALLLRLKAGKAA